MGKTVKMGLLGMGRIGKLHAMNIQNSLPNAEIIVAVDPFLNEEMEAWAKGIGITNCSKDPKDVFENKEGNLYVSHDPNLKRIAKVNKNISDMTDAELDSIVLSD